jgi:hypothetical protein
MTAEHVAIGVRATVGADRNECAKVFLERISFYPGKHRFIPLNF